MKITIDRASIQPQDLIVSGEHEIIITDRGASVPADRQPYRLAAVVVGLIDIASRSEPGYIKAIKEVREITGWSLAQSRDFIQTIRGRLDAL